MERRRYPECEVRPLPSQNIVLSLFLQALQSTFNNSTANILAASGWKGEKRSSYKNIHNRDYGIWLVFQLAFSEWIESSSTLGNFFSAAVEKVKPTKNRLKSH